MEREPKRIPFYKIAKLMMPPDSSEEAIIEAAQSWAELMQICFGIYERLKREGKLEEALASYRKSKNERSGN